ncbi:MAG: DUF3365 domain-containing protein [Rhodospirillaceae bacterium]
MTIQSGRARMRGAVSIPTVIALALATALRAGSQPQAPFPAETARAERAMNELQQALLARLTATMASGGPAAAVEVCRTEARAIADAVAKEQGLELGRTSHRLRNPANAPPSWARAIVDGASGAKASAEKLRTVDLGDRVGVLRPIGTAEACTKCHGAEGEVRRNIGTVLAAAYPEDRATGFAPGDLRGWMWAVVPKDR